MAIFGVIADDLTGGCDTGVQFSSVGLVTRIYLSDLELDADADADVSVITTDSRGLAAGQAAGRVRRAVRRLRGHGVERYYKKIDSTGRGRVAVEISAMLAECETGTLAVICPAYAPLGRTVVGGCILVDGKPAHRAGPGGDPVNPLRTQSIPALLSPHMAGVAQITHATVMQGAETIRAALKGVSGDASAVVVDATSDADLGNIARALEGVGRPILPVGSAGLARALAPHWRASVTRVGVRGTCVGPPTGGPPAGGARDESQGPSGRAGALHRVPTASGVTLVVVGSLHPTSRKQSERLSEVLHWPSFVIDIEAARTNSSAWRRSLETLVEQGRTAAGDFGGLVLTTPSEGESPRSAIEKRSANERGGVVEEAARIADVLAEAAVAFCDGVPVRGLMLTGGDSARAVLRRMQATGLRLTDEVAPGMPAGCIVGGPFAGMDVITKSGGFGDMDGLLPAARYLERIQNGRTPPSHPPVSDGPVATGVEP